MTDHNKHVLIAFFLISFFVTSSCAYRQKEPNNETTNNSAAYDTVIEIQNQTDLKYDLHTQGITGYNFGNFPLIYLTLDPSIPPFNSQLVSMDLNSVLAGKIEDVEVISMDSGFLGREPNLTWSPDRSKAVFVNMNGVFLFDPKTNSFKNLPLEQFHQTSVYWNDDNFRFAIVVENGKKFSSDVLMMDSQAGYLEQFSLDPNKFPTILGWRDSRNLLLIIEEFGFTSKNEKAQIIDRKLMVLNVVDRSFTEILPQKNWLKTGNWELSPDGNVLLVREQTNDSGETLESKVLLIDLATLSERELKVEQGILKWFNPEDILVYDIGFGKESASLAWIKKWVEIQHIRFDEDYTITNVLVTPDGNAVVVFLSGLSLNRPGMSTEYKAFIITHDGQQKEFEIPGISSSDWIVRFATWGK